MKLVLKNIGKIGIASVDIKGITVIAGENNTGKSTISRSLFAVFNSFFDLQNQLKKMRTNRLMRLISSLYYDDNSIPLDFFNTYNIAKEIVSHIEEYRGIEFIEIKRKILKIFSNYFQGVNEFKDKNYLDNIITSMKDIIDIADVDLLKTVLERNLKIEFNHQISNINSDEDGEIELHIKENIIGLAIKNDGSIDLTSSNLMSLNTEVIYIDDPFVLDEPHTPMPKSYNEYMSESIGHRNHLRKQLFLLETDSDVFDEILVKEKLSSIYEKISGVCSGDILRNKTSPRGGFMTGYQRKGSDKILNVKNLSTGLKTFVILKMLLTSGRIEQNGTIILDEPEIHLHPEWQLLFAELIILIQKEFGLHVLLNTHSPYFLNAIEVYSAKYGINDKCKYYLASNKDDISMIEDVTKNIEAIYSKLAKPLQKLENEGSLL